MEVVTIKDTYKTFGIYRITNKTSGMTYVGKTGMNFGDRWDCHRSQLRNGSHSNSHLQNAWNKYGESAFEFCVLEVVSDVSLLNELEIKYIKQYKEINKSYNILDGGDGGFSLGSHLSEETKRKIGEKNRINMMGRKLSDETRKKMSESHKKRCASWTDEERANHGRVSSICASGYNWSQKSRDNFSKLQQTKPNGAKLSIDDVHRIRYLYEEEGRSFKEISEALGIPRSNVYNIATYRRWANA